MLMTCFGDALDPYAQVQNDPGGGISVIRKLRCLMICLSIGLQLKWLIDNCGTQETPSI